MSSDYRENNKRKQERADPKSIRAPTRTEVLFALWQRAKWIDQMIENRRVKLNANLKSRIYMCQVCCQLCRTILNGLKNEELEVRIEELEKKIKDGILIEPIKPPS